MVALEFYIIAITNRKRTGRPREEVSLCCCGIRNHGQGGSGDDAGSATQTDDAVSGRTRPENRGMGQEWVQVLGLSDKYGTK